ncbi:hypothetical protein C7212DRAFT_352792 [Tuber magnatum]|uniref:Cyclin C-terminal domain-containing protein n=1 Tax=Tuber magnatum TaxID=42249 RepID=A0A317SL34_9PEZI|nr:hypothetical protein C7212DRAFT_352792 [Tuber magnatum]
MDDTIYSTSTQHRLFTFTPRQLSDLRYATNNAAVEKITESIKRRAAAAGIVESEIGEIDCPTAEEELKLVAYYCVKCMQLSDHFQFPSNVKATALTFLHRLYLTTSTLTLHPKKLLLPILYLATKTENHYTPINSFIETAATAGPQVTKEDLLDPEFTIAMGLRWAFQENLVPPAAGAKVALLELLAGDMDRIGRAHGEARRLLTTTALLTDVYFLYTPPQISFGAFLEADRELATFYLDVKFPESDLPARKAKTKLLGVLDEIAKNHLSAGLSRESKNPYQDLLLQLPHNGITTSLAMAVDSALVKEVTRIDKKLYRVTKRDQDSAGKKKTEEGNGNGNGSQSGNGNGNGNGKYDEDEERRAKKRRLEREKAEREGDVFGASLSDVKTAGAGSF